MLPYRIGFVYRLDNIILYRLSEYWLNAISVHLYLEYCFGCVITHHMVTVYGQPPLV